MTTEHAAAAPPATTGGAAPRPDSGKAEGPSPQERKRIERRSRWYRWDLKFSPYAFISPFFLFFAAFGLFPLLYTGWAALHQASMVNPNEMEWVGFDNFSRLWNDEFFWNALRNTFTIGIISTVPQLLMALGLAHVLNYRMRGSMAFRVAMLTPYATSVAAATLVFAMLYGRDYGMINWALDLVGIDPVNWEAGTWTSQFAISTIVIWRWTGYNTLIYLAAMQAVPNDLYESASLDGASRWQQFRHVTIPALRPTILFTVVVSTIGATQLFGEPYLLAGSENGGAQSQYQTLGLYMYETGWFNLHLGRAAAIAWTMFLLLIVIGLLYWVLTRLVGKSNGEEA
ncbi:cellobiose ABC transporter membrane protein [Streptomyces zhaozhouensis]|uniref:Cellobiose ABC transporter membrane protein n=1 Tax=Streptomyces zhaozhouensis TaxID=1300267 RepID=A0A286DQE3_9ACTN|nr:sugar ABC transporter permease [Streptomyces zhaozhouensis]SOD60885.1 cellobiose ABC transporter membrane protein [Streptomyces zhaozhouensis]